LNEKGAKEFGKDPNLQKQFFRTGQFDATRRFHPKGHFIETPEGTSNVFMSHWTTAPLEVIMHLSDISSKLIPTMALMCQTFPEMKG